jgi:tyrosyl-tRNA synthetase
MSIDAQMELLERGSDSIYSSKELRAKLEQSEAQGRPLRVKLGLDPTAPDIHLGHTVVLRKLRQFQDLGHRAVLIIGDYTAMIGDPTGKSQTRPMLTAEQIDHNAQTYLEQAGRVLDTAPERLEMRRNSEWLGQMTFADVLRLASRKTVARMLERDTFEKRYKAGQEIGIHEMLYPLMQGWDSVCVQADVELGGTEQTFNNLVGRDLQKMEDQPPQVVVIMPLLVGLDGHEKMSKSLGNYVGVTEPASQVFGKLMSIPDSLMINYFTLLTEEPTADLERLVKEKPRDTKVRLASTLAAIYHGDAAAATAEKEFFATMSGALPDEIPEVVIASDELTDGTISPVRLAVLCGFASSNGEGRRLIKEGGLRLNQAKLDDPNVVAAIATGDVVQRGKRRFVRLRIE